VAIERYDAVANLIVATAIASIRNVKLSKVRPPRVSKKFNPFTPGFALGRTTDQRHPEVSGILAPEGRVLPQPANQKSLCHSEGLQSSKPGYRGKFIAVNRLEPRGSSNLCLSRSVLSQRGKSWMKMFGDYGNFQSEFSAEDYR
jgi:hypothetical protein